MDTRGEGAGGDELDLVPLRLVADVPDTSASSKEPWEAVLTTAKLSAAVPAITPAAKLSLKLSSCMEVAAAARSFPELLDCAAAMPKNGGPLEGAVERNGESQ